MKFLLRAVAMLTLVVTVPAMAGGDAAVLLLGQRDL